MRAHKHILISLLVGLAIAGGALAGSVTLPHTFQANTPARASEVNANFNAVKVAVDDNASRVTGLESSSSQNWKRGGNTGTSIATDYLGTADNQGLELRVNASRAMQILPTGGTSPNVIFGASDCAPSLRANVKGVFIGGGNARARLTACANNVNERHHAYDNNVAVLGGYGNRAGSDDADLQNSEYAVVLGGVFNSASGYTSAVLGGDSNIASGGFSVAIGGANNQALGAGGVAIGTRAVAGHANTFVFSDGTTDFASSAARQFAVRAAGGIYFGSSGAAATMPTGAFIATSTGATLSTGGTWTNASDIALKGNLAEVNEREILESVKSLPVYTWNYKAEGVGVRHIGPTAQDFAVRFAFGADDKHIATVDADGVSLAAIKGLARIVEAQDELIATQQQRLADLESRLSALEKH